MQFNLNTSVALGSKFKSRRVQTNLGNRTYYEHSSPFLNWYRISYPPYVTANGSDQFDNSVYGLYLTPDGELINPVPAAVTALKTLFHTVRMAGEPFTVKWDGSATLTIGGATNVSTGAGTASFNAGPDQVTFSWAVTNRNDPPRNIRIYQSRYATNVANGEMFNPDWLKEARKYNPLRTMDWQATNFSPVVNFSDITPMTHVNWSMPTDGPNNKIGTPLGVICALANATGCDVHICIPHQMNDAGVTALATFMRDNITGSSKVFIEWSNETWNSAFNQSSYANAQGPAIFASGDNWGDGRRWVGLRASQCMNIVRNVYGVANRARWHGVIGGWTVGTEIVDRFVDGFNRWKSDAGSSLVLTDLFNSVQPAGYFSGVYISSWIGAVTRANPGVVTVGFGQTHDFQTGDKVRFSFRQGDGMEQLNGVEATVTRISATQYSIGINTTAYTPLVANPTNSYAHEAKIFQLMDQSEAWHASTPGSYPTKYTYFNQQMRDALLTGSSSSGLVWLDPGYTATIPQLTAYWQTYKAWADAHGLELRMYEGGCHFLGDTPLQGYGGSNPLGDRFTDFMEGFHHSSEVAEVYTAAIAAWASVGGLNFSKFNLTGETSRYGGWGLIRYLPSAEYPAGDAGNPVSQSVSTASGGLILT